MYFLHLVLPDEPEEGAKGPLPLSSGLAKGTAEGGIVLRHVVKGSEGEQREPDWGGPQPGLSRGSWAGVEGLEVRVQDEEEGAKIIRGAGGPYVF